MDTGHLKRVRAVLEENAISTEWALSCAEECVARS